MPRATPMTRYIALLRGINVGGHRVTMTQLRKLFEALRYSSVTTFIASGNVIFETSATDTAAIEKRIETHLSRALGYEVDTFIRTPADLAAISAFRPFAAKDLAVPAHRLYVAFLRGEMGIDGARTLPSFCTPTDELRARGRELYWLCRCKFSESTVSWPKVTKAIGMSSTIRNVKTVRQLVQKYPPPK